MVSFLIIMGKFFTCFPVPLVPESGEDLTNNLKAIDILFHF